MARGVVIIPPSLFLPPLFRVDAIAVGRLSTDRSQFVRRAVYKFLSTLISQIHLYFSSTAIGKCIILISLN